MPSMLHRILLTLVALALLLALGPRPSVDELSVSPPTLPTDLEAYLQERESRLPGLVPGAEKRIRWAHTDRRQTELALVYLHGFSASRQETAPLSENLARRLGANLFETRLAGHGSSPEAMGRARAEDWLSDAEEALAIARRQGRKVVLIGVSTGGTLATWLASRHPDLAAVVLISPNFAPRDPMARLLTWPWAEQLLPLVLPAEHVWKPRNAEQARYWNHRYPSRALFPMMALVEHVEALPLERIEVPVLQLYDPADRVVDAQAGERAFARLGSPDKRLLALAGTQDDSHHVIAGRILSPRDTPRAEQAVLDFLGERGPRICSKPRELEACKAKAGEEAQFTGGK